MEKIICFQFKVRTMAGLNNKITYTIILIIIIYFIFSAVTAQEECSSCHKIRHGQTGDFCDNCHNNTNISNGKHIQKPFTPGFVHDSFDWEGDNANERGLDRLNESCPVCHVSMLEHTSQTLNLCEDCHVKEKMKKSKLILVREDIGNYTPRVYSHYNGSSIDVPDQSVIGKTKSSCFGYDARTGEGSCHGVNFAKKGNAGGFFAFNDHNFTGKVQSRGDPYHWNAPVDFMPDSKNCVFCHMQEDAGIRKAWGNARPLPQDSSHLNEKNDDCLDCHVERRFTSFHGKEIVLVMEKSYFVESAMIILGISIVAGILFWRKQR